MTITAANGDKCVISRSTLLTAPRFSVHGGLGAKNQEKAPNSVCAGGHQDPEAPKAGLALPPRPPPRFQEPVKLKHRHDTYNTAATLLPDKQRSAVVAALRVGNVNWAPTAPPPSPLIVQEQGDIFDCAEPIGSHHSASATMDQKKPQIVRKPVKHDNGKNCKEACWLINKKKWHTAILAACISKDGALDEMNSIPVSNPSSGIQEPISSTRCTCTPIKKAKAVGERKTIKRSADFMTTEPPFISLSSRLRCLGVTSVTPILPKTLTLADSRLCQARLEFTSWEFKGSPLMNMLTPNEYTDVHTTDGLPVETLDRHGHSYDMRFGYVKLCNSIAYHLKKGWRKFLTQSGVREGALVEVGAFLDGRLMLVLLNYTTDGWIPEETEAANNLLLLSDFRSLFIADFLLRSGKNPCATWLIDELLYFTCDSLRWDTIHTSRCL